MKAKRRLALAMSAALGMGAACAPALAEEPSGAAEDDGNYFRLGGYVRGWAAFNLQDIPETKGNDKGKMSMLRGSILLDADAATGPGRPAQDQWHHGG